MSSQYHLFDEIKRAGFTLSLRGSSLVATPSNAITSDVLQWLKANKPELVAMLERSERLPPCDHCQGCQMAVRTFDGFENYECTQCHRCSGCAKIGGAA